MLCAVDVHGCSMAWAGQRVRTCATITAAVTLAVTTASVVCAATIIGRSACTGHCANTDATSGTRFSCGTALLPFPLLGGAEDARCAAVSACTIVCISTTTQRSAQCQRPGCNSASVLCLQRERSASHCALLSHIHSTEYLRVCCNSLPAKGESASSSSCALGSSASSQDVS